jgi:hypothetical protein
VGHRGQAQVSCVSEGGRKMLIECRYNVFGEKFGGYDALIEGN